MATDPMQAGAETLRIESASVMLLAVNGQLAGLLAVSDPIKDSTWVALQTLRKAGIRVVMATGDGLTTAKPVVQRLGINGAWRGQARRKARAGRTAAGPGAGGGDGRRR